MQPGKQANLYRTLKAGIVILLLCYCSTATAQGKGAYSIDMGIEFSHGDYGTGQASDSYFVPLTLEYSFTERLSVALGIPYIYQSNNATVFLGGGRSPMHTSPRDNNTGGGDSSGSGNGDMGHDSGNGHGGMGPDHVGNGSMDTVGTGSSSSVEFSNESQQGFGDLTLTADYAIFHDRQQSLMVRSHLLVKFPTANDDKGLGTGAYDYGGGLSISKELGEWLIYTELLYVDPGSSNSYKSDSYWQWSASTSYPVSDRMYMGVEISGATAPFEGADDALDLRLQASYGYSHRANIGGYLATGLSQGSADYGIGFFVSIDF